MKVIGSSAKSTSAKKSLVRNVRTSIKGNSPVKPTANRRFSSLASLVSAYSAHSWTRATVSAVSKSALGSGWSIKRHPTFEDEGTEEERMTLVNFMSSRPRGWNNIKDYFATEHLIYSTAGALKLLGVAAWEVIYDDIGNPVGVDFISGKPEPQVKDDGTFLSPAFLVYPWGGGDAIKFENPSDIVYFVNPGVTGNIMGDTDYEALVSTTIPSDLFASVSYREMFHNVNSPYNGIWEISDDTTDEDFDYFLALLNERYSSPESFGRNPLVIRGGVEWKPVKSRNSEDAPYLEGRRYNQEEISAVTGVDGNKLGITGSSNKANIRETRREFHENTMRPIFSFIESAVYAQVCLRLFGIRGWRLEFGRPDFTTALEDSTIRGRDLQWGVISPNEARESIGRKPREDGDDYYTPANVISTGDPEGTSTDGQATGDSSGKSENDPVRVPRDEESDNVLIAKEVKEWERFTKRVMSGHRANRKFVFSVIPAQIADSLEALAKTAIESGRVDLITEASVTVIDMLKG